MSHLLSCQAITKSYSIRPLFREISLGLAERERMGLIGPNGSGKSTLLKILAGLEKPDSGEVARRRDIRMVYVSQEDTFSAGLTVQEVLEAALADEVLEDYERTAQINIVLARVGFVDSSLQVETLSGGWKKRLALAQALIQRPDVMLLDEPTNHLDLEGVLWLERFLQEASFAVLVVTHDRYFLENVTNRIVELNAAYPEGYLSVEGAYSAFLLKKEAFLHAQAREQHALEGKVKREVEWLGRSAPARTTKADGRIRQAEQLIGELAEVKFRNTQDKTVAIDFSATKRKTRELLVAKEISKALGGRSLFSGLNVTLSPGTKLGLLGPNGSGKTTLLRLLTSQMEPDAGVVKKAEGLRIVYFDQHRTPLEREVSLKVALCPNGDNVVYQGNSIHVVGWARRFLFRAEQLDMPVGSLSGGEQARVLIAQLMLNPADILILDEPTNDLDIPSLEVLEESLSEFTGAVILVTHDRFLLDRLSTDLLALDGKGNSAYFAEYAQWEYRLRERQATEEAQARATKQTPKPTPSSTQPLNAQERRELNQMEDTILAAEEKVAEFQREMEKPEVATDPAKLQAAWNGLQAAQERVTQLYTRWETLENKRTERC